MPTQAEIEQLSEDLDDLNAVMIAALVAAWFEIVGPNPIDSLQEFREFVRDLVAEFGLAAAALAVEFYSAVRPPGSPAYTPTVVVAEDILGVGTLNWATAPLETEEWETALDRVAASIQKATKQATVDTIGEATEEDPLDVRFGRWPRNPDPCAWCVLRASRGAVYWSEASAERGDHLKCGCEVTPIFPGEELPYQRKPYYAQYEAGTAEANGRDLKAILAGMRRANGTR